MPDKSTTVDDDQMPDDEVEFTKLTQDDDGLEDREIDMNDLE